MSFTMPNTITNGETRDARPVQANFTAITAALQNDFVRKDGTISMTGALELSGSPTLSTQAADKAYVDASIPVGVIMDFAGAAAPSGWALCQGQLVNKADYPSLWALVGSTYGAATLTQFYLPDLRSRVTAGKGTAGWSDTLGEVGGSKDAIVVSHGHPFTTGTESANHSHSIPNHQHTVDARIGFTSGFASYSGAEIFRGIENSGADNVYTQVDGGGGLTGGISANHTHSGTTSSVGSSGTDANLPPYIVLNKIIRLG